MTTRKVHAMLRPFSRPQVGRSSRTPAATLLAILFVASLIAAMPSMYAPPLNSTPPRAPDAIAEMNDAGVLIINAQGDATVISTIAR